MAYFHGIRTYESGTGISTPIVLEASVPVVVGTAPVHKIEEGSTGAVNTVKLCRTYSEAIEYFGYDADWSKYTLSEVIYSQFQAYAIAPVLMINVFNPAVHRTTVDEEAATFTAKNTVSLKYDGILADPVVKTVDATTTYVKDVDYEVDRIGGVITRLTSGSIPASGNVAVSYVYGDPTLVTADDIIGGVDAGTNARTGFSLIDNCYTQFRIVPGMIAAPGWYQNDVITVALAKASSVNTVFKCYVVADIPDKIVTKYRDAVAYKNDNNLVDPELILCYGTLGLSDKKYRQSTQFCSLTQSITSNNQGIPHESPSNKNYKMDSMYINDEEVSLELTEANYLNSNGIVTALNFENGWTCWGNDTSAYPSSGDVKDYQIVGRQMFLWEQVSLIRRFWRDADKPMTKRLVTRILDTENRKLDGLTSAQKILGGRVEFNSDQNSTTSLMSGAMLFKVWMSFAAAAEDICFDIEYDPAYTQSLI
ncbi:MAG: phage tail sheath family protein [Deferribacterales bacterium]